MRIDLKSCHYEAIEGVKERRRERDTLREKESDQIRTSTCDILPWALV